MENREQRAERRVAQAQIALDERQQHVDRTDNPVRAAVAGTNQKNRSLAFPLQSRQTFDNCNQWGILVEGVAYIVFACSLLWDNNANLETTNNFRKGIMETVTDQLIIDKKDGVGRITFDNQARRNALTYEMWCGLPVVLEDFEKDDSVRVIVLAGAGGKAFSAGADISEFAKKRSGEDAVAIYDEAVGKATYALVSAR